MDDEPLRGCVDLRKTVGTLKNILMLQHLNLWISPRHHLPGEGAGTESMPDVNFTMALATQPERQGPS